MLTSLMKLDFVKYPFSAMHIILFSFRLNNSQIAQLFLNFFRLFNNGEIDKKIPKFAETIAFCEEIGYDKTKTQLFFNLNKTPFKGEKK